MGPRIPQRPLSRRRILRALEARWRRDAFDTAIHGSLNCHDVFGSIGTKLPEEIDHGDYHAIVELLIAAGAPLPRQVRGSEAVQDALRRAGVPDEE